MKLLLWLMIIALCLATVAVETADQESLNDMLVARYHGNQLSRGRRDDSSGNGGIDSQLDKLMQNLTEEIAQLLPIIEYYVLKMEKCGPLPARVREMVRTADRLVKRARSTGYIN